MNRIPRRSSAWFGCLFGIVLAVGLGVGLPAAVMLSMPQGGLFVQQLLSGQIQQALGTFTTLGAVSVGKSGTLAPGANDGPAQALLLTWQSTGTPRNPSHTIRLAALSTAPRKLLWQSAALDSQLDTTPILYTSDLVFIVSNQQLLALKRTDGTVAWQVTLADKLPPTSCVCVQLVGTQLVVLSDDGTLAVFDAATGQSQWQAHAKSASSTGLYVLGQRVAFMDSDAKKNGVLRTFDLQTGQETSVQPACGSAGLNDQTYPDWTTLLLLSPTGTDFYILFDTCAQRWDARSLKMVWSSGVDGYRFASQDAIRAVFSDDTIYLARDSDVLAFALDGGAGRVAVTDTDNHFDVLATHGADVIVRATRQSGTARDAIWAVNGASGQTHWTFDLGEAQSFQSGDYIDAKTPRWLAQPSADGLRVVRFEIATNVKGCQLLLDTLNWDTGRSAGQKSTAVKLNTSFPTAPDWHIWKNDTLWMGLSSQFVAFDAVPNKLIYQWP